MEEVAHVERDAVAGERELGVGARVVRDGRANRERDRLRARGLEQGAQRPGRVRAAAVVTRAGSRGARAATQAVVVGPAQPHPDPEALARLELELGRLFGRRVTVAALRALLHKRASKGMKLLESHYKQFSREAKHSDSFY